MWKLGFVGYRKNMMGFMQPIFYHYSSMTFLKKTLSYYWKKCIGMWELPCEKEELQLDNKGNINIRDLVFYLDCLEGLTKSLKTLDLQKSYNYKLRNNIIPEENTLTFITRLRN